jgi:hypothetical protein
MSEYQYYEFQAIDAPLTDADQKALRALSTRAEITTKRFTNSYDWGDFKGDPAKLMERWFDLHLYLANWGSRRLMMRLPKRLFDQRQVSPFLDKVDDVAITASGANLIVDIAFDEIEGDWGDESAWLPALAPLRDDVLAGDLGLFYILWLTAVESDAVNAEELEPMPGVGRLTRALEAFVNFFDIDPDLVAAAGESGPCRGEITPDAARKIIAAMSDRDKSELLMRLFAKDPQVAADLRLLVRQRLTSEAEGQPVRLRTVSELRSRAREIRRTREEASARRAAAERWRLEEQAEKARRERLDAIAQRGESVWREIETEIERRNASGYDRASSLLADLHRIAEERGESNAFGRQLRAIRERHANKKRFIDRLATM